MSAFTAAAACCAHAKLIVCRELRGLDAANVDELRVVTAVLAQVITQLDAIGKPASTATFVEQMDSALHQLCNDSPEGAVR